MGKSRQPKPTKIPHKEPRSEADGHISVKLAKLASKKSIVDPLTNVTQSQVEV